jgi:hypothetical protein
MAVHGPPAGARERDQIRTQEHDCRAWGGGGTVGWVDTWFSLYMHGCPTM